jgi:hypothetical protein
MNQRIDQLWAQALDAAVPETYTQLSHSQVLKIKQVFAELIINDVMNELFVVYPGGKNGSDVKYQNITARQWINQVFNIELNNERTN